MQDVSLFPSTAHVATKAPRVAVEVMPAPKPQYTSRLKTKKMDTSKNVFDAAQERLDFLFENFERIYLSFSGGKDSGVMLNLVLDYMKRNNIRDKKLGIMVMDNEANYEHSMEYMHRMMRENREWLEIYWCCLPITLPCTISSYAIEWQCWGERDKERWIRPLPTDDYIVNFHNHPFPFFKEDQDVYEFWDKFGDWYSQGKRCASLIGIRTVESLNRFRAIMNPDKETLHGQMWTKRNSEHVYNCYPIYDWRTEDIWTANAKFEWDYNKLYDIFYKAGVPVHRMRVASPFMSESKSSLGLYRVIDPHTWAKLCARVQGANFIATYGKQLNYNSFKLPAGHTWKSFVEFLLMTLPKEVAENFRMRFAESVKYWSEVGGTMADKTLEELRRSNVPIAENGFTNHGRKDKVQIRLLEYPDHVDFLSCHNSEIASWKRCAITILKNDHVCKYMGWSQTKQQITRQRELMEKYKKV